MLMSRIVSYAHEFNMNRKSQFENCNALSGKLFAISGCVYDNSSFASWYS